MEKSHSLPERPSLEQLRKQARELQRVESSTLAEAQHRVAARYGFSSWPKLKRHVEELSGLRTETFAFVEAALAGRLDEADAIGATGDLPALMRGEPFDLDPNGSIGPRRWPPLLYLCWSRYHQREDCRPGLLANARRLLEAGADPNASWTNERYPDAPETCLYGVCGVNDHPEMVSLLLEFGANPQDAEALYHGTELETFECLRRLFAAGASPKGTNCVAHMLDRDRADGLELVLAHYGERDDALHRAIHDALDRDRSVEHLRLILRHGADPDFRHDGVSAYARAVLSGMPEHAEALRGAGVSTGLSRTEAFVAACVNGGPVPPVDEPPLELAWAVHVAARRNRHGALSRLLGNGFPPSVADPEGVTALHWAAWEGQPEATEVLLAHGADPNAVETRFGCTPLGWAVFGDRQRANPKGAYRVVARAILEKGGRERSDYLREAAGDRPAMAATLREFGLLP
ncbi:MAG: ankyrin repeat domain-containing protein [Fimbriimonadaceae bacterium]